jgi:hypothetical protein
MTTRNFLLVLLGSAVLVVAPADAGSLRWASGYGHPKEPQLCKTPSPGKRGKSFPGTPRVDTFCGTRGADEFVAVGGGDHVEGYDGADVIKARNGKPDEVWGGVGSDKAFLDPCDVPNTRDVAKRDMLVGGRCPGIKPRRATTAGLDDDPPIRRPVIECYVEDDGERVIDLLVEPQMRALDVTGAVDFQTVTWSAALLAYENNEWHVIFRGSWFWDRTYDEQVEAFPGNYWRSFRDGERTFVSYVVPSPGTYAVGVLLHWYPTKKAPARDEVAVARAHYGPNANPTDDACVFEA